MCVISRVSGCFKEAFCIDTGLVATLISEPFASAPYQPTMRILIKQGPQTGRCTVTKIVKIASVSGRKKTTKGLLSTDALDGADNRNSLWVKIVKKSNEQSQRFIVERASKLIHAFIQAIVMVYSKHKYI